MSSDRLDPESAEAVLRRAAELASSESAPSPAAFDRGSLADAAAEVGIDRGAIERALAEHDAGVLARQVTSPGLLGHSRVSVSRVVKLTAPTARQVVRQWLKGQMLQPHERRDGLEVWARRDDFLAKVRRRVDLTKKLRLGNIDAVRFSVAEAGPGRSLIHFEIDLDAMRRGLLTGVVVIPTAVTPVLGACGVLLTGEVAFLIGSVPVGLTLGALGIVGGRRTLRGEHDDAARTLELYLDELS